MRFHASPRLNHKHWFKAKPGAVSVCGGCSLGANGSSAQTGMNNGGEAFDAIVRMAGDEWVGVGACCIDNAWPALELERLRKRRWISYSFYMKFNQQAGAWAIIHCASTDTFLFGRRSIAMHKPGVWNFFGGHVELHETPEEALVRELSEELGITRTHDQLVRFGKVSGAAIEHLGYVDALRELHYFLLRTDHEFEPRLNFEHSAYAWCKAHNVPRNLNRPTAIGISIGLIHKAAMLARES